MGKFCGKRNGLVSLLVKKESNNLGSTKHMQSRRNLVFTLRRSSCLAKSTWLSLIFVTELNFERRKLPSFDTEEGGENRAARVLLPLPEAPIEGREAGIVIVGVGGCGGEGGGFIEGVKTGGTGEVGDTGLSGAETTLVRATLGSSCTSKQCSFASASISIFICTSASLSRRRLLLRSPCL